MGFPAYSFRPLVVRSVIIATPIYAPDEELNARFDGI